MCGGKKHTLTPAAAATPAVPQIVQEMTRASEMGPGGFTPAMRANTGMDIQKGGALPESGMTHFDATNFAGYQPRAATPDPLIPITQPYVAPPPPPPVVAPPPVKPTITDRDLIALLHGATGRNSR